MSKLFVYGIFLNDHGRQDYGMTNPRYAVVQGFKTVHIGGGLVKAVRDYEAALTGLIVSLPDDYDWTNLDNLEGGYNRIEEVTIDGEECFIYIGK